MITTNSGLMYGPRVNWMQPILIYAQHRPWTNPMVVAGCDTVGEAKRFIKKNKQIWCVLSAVRSPKKQGRYHIVVVRSRPNPNPDRVKRLQMRQQRYWDNYDGNCQ